MIQGAAMTAGQPLPGGRYISLVTYRRDGREVATPLWFAEREGKLYAFTLGGSAKVRRLRNRGDVRVASCTLSGRVGGPWRAGRGRIVESPEAAARAYAAIAAKYGLSYWISTLFSKLSGRIRQRVVLELSLDAG